MELIVAFVVVAIAGIITVEMLKGHWLVPTCILCVVITIIVFALAGAAGARAEGVVEYDAFSIPVGISVDAQGVYFLCAVNIDGNAYGYYDTLPVFGKVHIVMLEDQIIDTIWYFQMMSPFIGR